MFNFSKNIENPTISSNKKEIDIVKEIPIEEKMGIKNSEIEKLSSPMNEVLSQLRNKLESGEYDIIIGDDASGRVVSLALGNIINNIYKEHGYKKPNHLFLAGQRHQNAEEKSMEIGEHLENTFKLRGIDKPKKVLIVTDAIEGGTSLTPVTKYLTEKGIEHDIATMSFHEVKYLPCLEIIFNGNIYGPTSGLYSDEKHAVYGRRDLGGTQKNRGDVLSQRYSKYKSNKIKQAREDIKILSDNLSEQYIHYDPEVNNFFSNNLKRRFSISYANTEEKFLNTDINSINNFSNTIIRLLKEDYKKNVSTQDILLIDDYVKNLNITLKNKINSSNNWDEELRPVENNIINGILEQVFCDMKLEINSIRDRGVIKFENEEVNGDIFDLDLGFDDKTTNILKKLEKIDLFIEQYRKL